jgi:hypothetical protein
MTGVLTPILHATVVDVLGELRRNGFMERLPREKEAENGAELISEVNQSLTNSLEKYRDKPLMLNDAQTRIASRFAGFYYANARENQEVSQSTRRYLNAPFARVAGLMESAGKQVAAISSRHQELRSTEALTEFMRSDVCLSVLRTIASGGNGFSDGLLGRNNAPETAPWRDDPFKPYLEFTPSGEPRPTADLIRAAKLSHDRNYEMESLAGLWPKQEGTLGVSKRHSAGCPVRTLIFRPRTDNLVRMGVALTDEQLEQLSRGPDPKIVPIGDGRYQVVRDAYRETVLFLADAADIMLKAHVIGFPQISN